MKKAEIITIFDNTNFGTYLQALALALVIKKSGFEVEIVDYWKSHATLTLLAKQDCPLWLQYD